MKTHFIIPLVLLSLVSSPSWGLSMDDLVQREGVYYQKFTDVPFTGEIGEGREKGQFIRGKKDGKWIGYHSNGQLRYKGNWINGQEDGYWNSYFEDGGIATNGKFENGKKEGYWEFYTVGGHFSSQYSGTYRNDVKVSD